MSGENKNVKIYSADLANNYDYAVVDWDGGQYVDVSDPEKLDPSPLKWTVTLKSLSTDVVLATIDVNDGCAFDSNGTALTAIEAQIATTHGITFNPRSHWCPYLDGNSIITADSIFYAQEKPKVINAIGFAHFPAAAPWFEKLFKDGLKLDQSEYTVLSATNTSGRQVEKAINSALVNRHCDVLIFAMATTSALKYGGGYVCLGDYVSNFIKYKFDGYGTTFTTPFIQFIRTQNLRQNRQRQAPKRLIMIVDTSYAIAAYPGSYNGTTLDVTNHSAATNPYVTFVPAHIMGATGNNTKADTDKIDFTEDLVQAIIDDPGISEQQLDELLKSKGYACVNQGDWPTDTSSTRLALT